jgi:hypothetical protein
VRRMAYINSGEKEKELIPSEPHNNVMSPSVVVMREQIFGSGSNSNVSIPNLSLVLAPCLSSPREKGY